jgi:myo-inositol-1(or 4)-monophosphatase
LPASDAHDLAREAERLTGALREAGALALKGFRAPLRSWLKDGHSPVSEVDIAVDTLLRERLSPAGYGWLSEESKDDPARLKARRVFVVDPIDGTRAFIAGKPDWTIAAALVEDGRPVVGVVYAPVDGEMFVATAGHGATCNARPIQASGGEALEGARLAGPRGEIDRIARGLPAIPKIHSLALRLSRVAQGSVDAAFVSIDAHDWDLAAADLLVHEAGGAVTTLAGTPLTYNRQNTRHGALVAAGRARHAAMVALLRDCRAENA